MNNNYTEAISSMEETSFNFISQNESNLIDKWDLYYHLSTNNDWSLSSYKLIMGGIDSVEKVVALNTNISENIVKTTMLFVMKSGIKPLWEDPRNKNGGGFSFKVVNKYVPQVWKELFYALCGGTLATDKKHYSLINGITISPKRNFCIIKIWLADSEEQDPKIISEIPNLSKQGCLFKKHGEENRQEK